MIIPDDMASGKVKWFGGSGRKPPSYIYPNGSVILVGGMDQPGKFLSMDLDRVLVDEANQVSLTAFETLMTRMRGSAGTFNQIMLATNPDHPAHWIKERADSGKLPLLTSMHKDNPYLYRVDGSLTEAGEKYLTVLRSLTGVRRARYYEGRWQASEGTVYDDWDDAVNLVDPFPVPDEWPLIISIDWGYAHPLVVQFWRIDPDGRMYLTHEIARSGILVEDMAKRVKSMLDSGAFPRPTLVVADHDAEDRATFARHSKLTLTPAYKAVSVGVQLTQNRIRKAGDGRPRLMVFRDALMEADPIALERKQPRGVAAEVGGHVWAVERGADGIPKESPLKINDDSMDAMRYAVCSQDRYEPSQVHNPARAAAPQQNNGGKWSTPVGR